MAELQACSRWLAECCMMVVGAWFTVHRKCFVIPDYFCIERDTTIWWVEIRLKSFI